MIISRKRRYVFVHIPKTGGTALALALEARAAADDILIGDTPKARRRKRPADSLASGKIWKHSTISDIQGLVSDREIAEFFTLTLVRNPWDRMLSYYSWLQEQRFSHPAVDLAKHNNFKTFMDNPQTVSSLQAWPYGAYMRDAAGVERCRLFARLEHLADDLAPFVAHLGFQPEILRINQSDRPRDWRSAYDPETAALVARVCAEDIARFGYSFDDPAS